MLFDKGTTRREHTSSIWTLVDERRAGSRMSQVEKRLHVLKSGLDELLLMLVLVADEVREREQLMQVITAL
jgi:hypothetical protein